VARIGGDEFALLLPETDRLQGLSVVERLRRLWPPNPWRDDPSPFRRGSATWP